MKRSKWKLNFLDDNKKIEEIVQFGKLVPFVLNRSQVISFKFYEKLVFIYNGRKFFSSFIDRGKIGAKFGELCYSRQKGIHKSKTKRWGTK